MIQNIMINYLMKPLTRMMSCFSERAKEYIFICGGILLFLLNFIVGSELFELRYIYIWCIGCVGIALMILGSLEGQLFRVKFSRDLLLCWLIVGGLIFVSSIRFNSDWLTDALMYLVICPVLFIVWGNIKKEKLFRLLTKICEISFVIYFIVSALFFEVESKEYSGLYYNENGASQYLTLVFVCLLVDSLCANSIKKKIVYWILLGNCGALIFYTNSRTGQLAAVCALIVVFAAFVLRHKCEWKKAVVLNVIPVLLVVGICLPLTLNVLKAGNFIENCIYEICIENSDENSNGLKEQNNDKKGNFGSFVKQNNKGLDVKDKTLDSYSAGRISIWKEYLKHLTLFGSGEEEKFWIESRECYYNTAHNMALTFAFRSGLVCGIIYLIFNCLSGMKAMMLVFRKDENDEILFPLAISVVFIITSMLASINTPYSYMITLYYYFIQTWIIIDKKESVI